MKSSLHFIGVVKKAGEQEAKVEIFPKFCDGLKGMKQFSHLIIIYWAHLRDNKKERRTGYPFSIPKNLKSKDKEKEISSLKEESPPKYGVYKRNK